MATDLSLATELSKVVCVLSALSHEQECMDTAHIGTRINQSNVNTINILTNHCNGQLIQHVVDIMHNNAVL